MEVKVAHLVFRPVPAPGIAGSSLHEHVLQLVETVGVQQDGEGALGEGEVNRVDTSAVAERQNLTSVVAAISCYNTFQVNKIKIFSSSFLV